MSLSAKTYGSLFKREERHVKITDKELAFNTKLGGTWPGTWAKKDITVKKIGWQMLFKVTWNDGSRSSTVSTYTRKTYFMFVLPSIVVSIVLSTIISPHVFKHSTSPNLYLYPLFLLIFLVSVQYPPYLRFKKALQQHGYIL